MNNWKKYYKLPLKPDPGGYSSYAWGADDGMVLGFDNNISREETRYFIDVINGNEKGGFKNVTVDETDIFINGVFQFEIRGWGNLTGTGGHNLSEEKAVEIQDAFRDFVVEQLKKE